jgi:glucan phosphoethanolaminetransferase (alkaline phosphatase superfamily)
MAAATATVPGRLRILRFSNNPFSKSLYTYSLRWVVILIYLGSNSRSVSIVLYSFSMPVPFRGGRISKEKAVFSLLLIKSITFILLFLCGFVLHNVHILAKIRKKRDRIEKRNDFVRNKLFLIIMFGRTEKLERLIWAFKEIRLTLLYVYG